MANYDMLYSCSISTVLVVIPLFNSKSLILNLCIIKNLSAAC